MTTSQYEPREQHRQHQSDESPQLGKPGVLAGRASPLHFRPPICPIGFFGNRPYLFAGTIAAALSLALLAALAGGTVLDSLDRPITNWIDSNRSSGATDFFNAMSRLGDNVVVFSAALAVAAVVWRRCRYLAIAFIGAAALRPALEFVLKDVIGRHRPDLTLGLGTFEGPSHPSGHPMAAISFYGLIPAAVALYTSNRRLWAGMTGLALCVPPLVAAARVYKGAHWTTDVVASLLWGSLYLLTVHGFFDRLHPDEKCRRAENHETPELVGAAS